MKKAAKGAALKELMAMIAGMGMLDKMPEGKSKPPVTPEKEDEEDDLDVVDAVPMASNKKPKGMQISLTRLSALDSGKDKKKGMGESLGIPPMPELASFKKGKKRRRG